MKAFFNIIRFEILSVIRGKFHIVLLITLAAMIGVFYLVPETLEAQAEYSETASVSIEILSHAEEVNLRETFIPTMLSFEVVILGFLFIAVTMFQEREEGVIRAYRVSPSGAASYTLAKLVIWTVISVLYGLLFVLSTAGLKVNWLPFVIHTAVSAMLMSSLGLITAVFFNNMSDWFFPGVAALTLNMIPQLINDNFHPLWMKIIPGYHMSRGYLAVFQGDTNLWRTIAGLAIAALLLLLTTTFAVDRKLMKEAN